MGRVRRATSPLMGTGTWWHATSFISPSSLAREGEGSMVVNPKEAAARTTAGLIIGRAIKRHRYDERAIIQILRLSPEKARAVLGSQLDGFGTDEIQRFANALE